MTSPAELRHHTIGRRWWGAGHALLVSVPRTLDLLVCGAARISERMTTRWQGCASAVLVIVFVVSNRVATARNQTVEQKIRDDPDLSEVRLISMKCILCVRITVFD